jgi:dynactin-5
MELSQIHEEKDEYVQTETGNKVSLKAHIYGSQNIVMNGKVTISGELHTSFITS